MDEEKKRPKGYVNKETLLIVAAIALIAGFLAGVLLTVYKSRSGVPSHGYAPHQQQPHDPEQHAVPGELAVKIFELEKKLSQNQSDFDQWVQLGNLYFDTNNHEKAIMAYNKSLEQHPGQTDVLTNLGIMYRGSGKYIEAVAAFDKAISSDPDHEISRFNKGIVLMHDLNNIEGAIKEWEKLVEINPDAMSPGGKSVGELIKRFKQNN